MRHAYIEELKKVVNVPIKTPTDADFKKLFPHLNDQQIKDIQPKNRLFSCPPTFISNCFTYFRYDYAYDAITKINIPMLRFAFVSSWEEEESFTKEASDYAKENWGDELCSDSSHSVIQILIPDREEKENAASVRKVFVSLDCDWNGVLDEELKPQSSLIDQHILRITTDSFFGEHLQRNRDIKKIHYHENGDKNRMFSSLHLPQKVTEYLSQEGQSFQNESENKVVVKMN